MAPPSVSPVASAVDWVTVAPAAADHPKATRPGDVWTEPEKAASLVAAFERFAEVFRWEVMFGIAVVLAGLFFGASTEGTVPVVLLSAMRGIGVLTVVCGIYIRRKYKRLATRLLQAIDQGRVNTGQFRSERPFTCTQNSALGSGPWSPMRRLRPAQLSARIGCRRCRGVAIQPRSRGSGARCRGGNAGIRR